MGTKKGGYIEKLLKKADKALQEGVKKADEVLDDAVELGKISAKQAAKKSKELRSQVKEERKSLQKRGSEKISEGISVPFFKEECTLIFEAQFGKLYAHVHITIKSKNYFNSLQ